MTQEQLPSAEEVSRTLADILGAPEFEFLQPDLLARLLNRFWTWFWGWMDGIFPDIPRIESELLTALIVTLGIGVVCFLTVQMLPRTGAHSTRADPDALPDELRSAGDWLRVAAERARGAEYRRAATALYQGFLLTLEGRGAVAFHPSKTPGEYALEATGGAAMGEGEKTDATSFIRSFERLAFGHGDPTPAGYHGLEELAGRVGCTLREDAGQ